MENPSVWKTHTHTTVRHTCGGVMQGMVGCGLAHPVSITVRSLPGISGSIKMKIKHMKSHPKVSCVLACVMHL